LLLKNAENIFLINYFGDSTLCHSCQVTLHKHSKVQLL